MCKNHEQEKLYCVDCGVELTEENAYLFDSEYYCCDCIDDVSFVCEHCGRRFYNDENAGDTDIDLCRGCYESYYTRCTNCERVIHNNSVYYLDNDYDEEPYCLNGDVIKQLKIKKKAIW